MPAFELLQITAQYSNAVLVAIMPHISECAKALNLPVPTPVAMAQINHFACSPRSDLVGGTITLTNGCEFAFLRGRVEMYRDPGSFFELQDPDLVPKFFGTATLDEKQALRIVHDTIKKLGYTDQLLSADKPPSVTPPPKVRSHSIPRFRVRWTDPTRGSNPENPPVSADFEVDAATGQIHLMYILNPNTWRRDPVIDVHPPILQKGPETVYRGGRKIYPVGETYSNAFLKAILPACGDFVKTAGFSVRQPISPADVEWPTYICGLVDDDPRAFFDLKAGGHFVYGHGRVLAFYAADVMQLPGRDWPSAPDEMERFQSKFYGPVNMTTNDAVNLVRAIVRKLGYSEKELQVDNPPSVNGPARWGNKFIARVFVQWQAPRMGPFRVVAEVDMAERRLASLYINDHANTNIWMQPPRIDAPVH